MDISSMQSLRQELTSGEEKVSVSNRLLNAMLTESKEYEEAAVVARRAEYACREEQRVLQQQFGELSKNRAHFELNQQDELAALEALWKRNTVMEAEQVQQLAIRSHELHELRASYTIRLHCLHAKAAEAKQHQARLAAGAGRMAALVERMRGRMDVLVQALEQERSLGAELKAHVAAAHEAACQLRAATARSNSLQPPMSSTPCKTRRSLSGSGKSCTKLRKKQQRSPEIGTMVAKQPVVHVRFKGRGSEG
eukprot:3197795-Amphidinium_carterae.1